MIGRKRISTLFGMLLAVASIQLSSNNDSPGKEKVKLIVRRCSVWSGSAKSSPTLLLLL
jgi:hypothetical protein